MLGGCRRSQATRDAASATASSSAARASAGSSSRQTPNLPSATRRSGTVLAQSPAHHLADRDRVGHGVLAHQAVHGLVAAALEVLDRGQHGYEVPQRALAGVRRAGVGGCADDRELERQCPGGRRHQGPGRRLGDDTRVGVVAAVQGGEGTEAAVLLTDHEVQGSGSLQSDARRADRPDRREVRHQAGLHVAGTSSLGRCPRRPRPEGVRRPGAQAAGRYDVDVRLECERGDAVARPGHQPPRLGALHLAPGEVRALPAAEAGREPRGRRRGPRRGAARPGRAGCRSRRPSRTRWGWRRTPAARPRWPPRRWPRGRVTSSALERQPPTSRGSPRRR